MSENIEQVNILVKTFGKDKRWVNWELADRDGKQTKIPLTITGCLASSTNEATWSTYDEVIIKSDKIGIVFGPDQTLLLSLIHI